MATKSVIQVDIDPEGKFRAFYDLFRKYAAEVGEMPDDWKKVTGATEDAGEALTELSESSHASKEALMVAAIQADAIGKSVTEAIKSQKEFANVARNGSSELEKMAKHAKALGQEVFGIGKFLMKLGALGVGATGVGAILSGLGLRDLARSAIDTRQEARGIGLNSGQLRAFEQDFRNLADPSMLHQVANAQADWGKLGMLSYAAGQSPDQVQRQSSDELMMRLMQRAHDWWNATPEAMRTVQNMNAHGFGAAFTFEDVRNLGADSQADLDKRFADYGADRKKYAVSDSATDAWWNFEREIENAGNTIKTDLTDRLSDLAPDLQHFVDVLGKDAKTLVDDILTPQNLHSLEAGIDTMTDYLGSQKFHRDMRIFADLVGLVAEKMRWAAQKLGIDVGEDKTIAASLDPAEVQRETHGLVRDFTAQENSNAAKYQALAPTFTDKLAGTVQKMSGEPGYFGEFEKSQALPTGLLYAQEMAESSGRIGAVSPKGAMGPFQFMPDTAAQYKLSDPYNLHDSASATAHMMGDLMRKYKGDIRKALAAYNWGMGDKDHPRLDADIARYGNQWESHLPAETRKYLDKITTALAKRQAVNLKVDVHNSTAAHVAVSTNAAATGS